jgi:phosphotransferase system HPr (HPr) family protein
MKTNAPGVCKFAVVRNQLGLHARTAGQIAKIAQASKADVWIIKDDRKADASSIIDMLTLACEKGTNIQIRIEDSADTEILEAIVDLVERGFGE